MKTPKSNEVSMLYPINPQDAKFALIFLTQQGSITPEQVTEAISQKTGIVTGLMEQAKAFGLSIASNDELPIATLPGTSDEGNGGTTVATRNVATRRQRSATKKTGRKAGRPSKIAAGQAAQGRYISALRRATVKERIAIQKVVQTDGRDAALTFMNQKFPHLLSARTGNA